MVEASHSKAQTEGVLDSAHRNAVAREPRRGVALGTRQGLLRLACMLLASLALHLLLTPIPALLGIIGMLPAPQLHHPEQMVEVELTSLPLAAPAPEPTRPPENDTAVDDAPPEAPVEPEKDSEAAVPPPPEPDDPQAATEASAPAPPPVPTPPSESSSAESSDEIFADPVALAGQAASIADQNANVRLFLSTAVIREHPLGPRVGALLRRTPQWRDFFGPSRIDPIEDVERVLIAGPELRSTSQIVAVVQHKLEPARIDSAFDALVARKGEWVDREARLARAVADRASRIFAAPNDEVVVVAPPQLQEQLRELGQEVRFPASAGDIALTAYIIGPATVAKGTGLRLPPSLEWVRLDLRPTEDGGAVLQILAQDESEALAAKNAAWVQRLVESVTTVDLSRGGGLGALASMLIGSKKVRMIQSVEFVSRGQRIEGRIVATRSQLMNLADLIDAFLPPEPETAPPSPPKEPEAAKPGGPSSDSAATDSEEGSSVEKQKEDSERVEAMAPSTSAPPGTAQSGSEPNDPAPQAGPRPAPQAPPPETDRKADGDAP